MGRWRRSGFTLVELVLVMTVVGILSVAAVPAFLNTGGPKADGAARKVVSDLSYARRLAQNRNGIYGVSFSAANDRYTVYLYNPATNSTTPITDPLVGTPMIVDLKVLPGLGGVDLQNPNFQGGTEVRFSPDGKPADANGVALNAAGSVILSNGGITRTVFVQPNTGEVSSQ